MSSSPFLPYRSGSCFAVDTTLNLENVSNYSRFGQASGETYQPFVLRNMSSTIERMN